MMARVGFFEVALFSLSAFMLQGCGGGGGGGGGEESPFAKGPEGMVYGPTQEPAMISYDMVDNLVICFGMGILYMPKGHDWNGEHGNANGKNFPCEPVPMAAAYYGTENTQFLYEKYYLPEQSKTENFVSELLFIADPINCAIKCQQHAECDGYNHWDAEGYKNDDWETCRDSTEPDGGCSYWAGTCELNAVCKACGDTVFNYFIGTKDGGTPRGYGGMQPDEEFVTGLTECPSDMGFTEKLDIVAKYGTPDPSTKAVTTAEATATTSAP